MGNDPASMVVIGLLGIMALNQIFQTIFGGGGGRGVSERMAVMETKIDRVEEDVGDLKAHFNLTRRTKDVDKESRHG